MTGTASTRPRFHFTPTTGWINDPHGITFRDGGYDVFFQYVPDAVWRPDCRWGHARGGDLLSLRELPIAIAPGEGDDGVWTGSLVVDDGGGVRAFYTSISIPEFGIGRVRTAVPAGEDWITWEKGPVVVEAPDGLDLVAFRDPFVRREGDRWRMFVGAGGRDGTAMALTYVCEDGLGTWRYDGVALRRSTDEVDPVWTGSLWECPQVFPIGDRWAMVSSVWDADRLHYVVYALGSYAEGRFDAEHWGRLTYGPSYYAPSLFFDREQRPCLSFWMRGIADAGAGWAGAHSVPHLLSLAGDRLRAMPHPDIERYQQGSTGGAVPAGVQAVDMSWDPTPGDRLGVSRGPGEVARFECRDGELGVRIGQSGWTVPGGDAVRIIVDGPVLEVATGRANFSAAIPTPPGRLTITSHGAPPHVRMLLSQTEQELNEPGSSRRSGV